MPKATARQANRPLPNPLETIRLRLTSAVNRLFHDDSTAAARVVRSDIALISSDSVAWRVHGDVTTMMVGGVAALLLQMLHPAALAGVWDHSDFERDMLGRLRRTARFIAVTTFGERELAEAAIARVRAVHGRIGGSLPDGSAYEADDPRLLAFVHIAGAICFLNARIRFAEPWMSRADQDAYFAEVAPIACALGANPVPTTRDAAERLLLDFRLELAVDARTRRIRDLILHHPSPTPRAAAIQALLFQSAIDLLPAYARRLHGVRASRLRRPALAALTFGVAKSLSWALKRR